MQRLDPSKAHSHDMISILILKMCGKPIRKPLELIFNECMSKWGFPISLEKGECIAYS